MYYRLFLLAALLFCSSGEPLVHGQPKTVLAFAGGDVILPCSFSITPSDDFPTVEWSKQDLQPKIVFLYRDGCETPEMKDPAFRYRTSLITKELKNGNISLRISNVQLADAGKYQCMTLWKKLKETTAVELFVGAVSEPKLSVTSAEDGAVTLQCDANCWLPEPEINFLDHQGNVLHADDSKRDRDVRGCYNVKRRVTLQAAAKRVVCRVHQPETNHTRDAQTLLPVDSRKSCSLIIAIAVGEAVLLGASCGLTLFLWRRRGKSAEVQKLPLTRLLSDQSTTSGASENATLLQSGDAVGDDKDSITIKMLAAEVANLKSKLREREATVPQLQSQLSAAVCQYDHPHLLYRAAAPTSRNPPKAVSLPQNKGPKPGITRQHSNPVFHCPIKKPHRRHSSPALLSFPALSSFPSGSALEKRLSRIGGSMTDDLAQPGPNAKLQRQHPSVSNSRFTRLADLTEESEMLIV